MLNFIVIFAGGGIGAVCRKLAADLIGTHWGTMVVNVTGAFLIGCAFEFFSLKTDGHPEMRSLIMTGFLGAFTTFSTYLLDFSVLMQKGKNAEAFAYLSGSVLIGLLFLFCGVKAVDFLMRG